MATALEILPLERVKLELEIPSLVVNHDALLAMQIAAAVDYVSEVTGIDYASADYDAASFPPGLVAVCAMMTRHLYDGMAEIRARSIIAAMIRPYISYA